ncbi:SGNH hydrolase [Streptomyces ruber]|uniref:SGNH hydrolase n=2 Tax=Streptomyces TaxID=1883 RepID=A0A918BAU2_9ACTN|nr:SGNH/GDSL hydrolase family protein [Streptomyces ruber]GGQ54171.1 SGNH hydrolase [Streptomyces ruber]
MTKRHGYALLAAICALIVAVSTAIYVGAAGTGPGGRTDDDGTGHRPLAGSRPHNSAAPASTGTWVGTWSASPMGGEPGTEMHGWAGRSVRNVVHAGATGTSARVTLSNLYGQQPLTLSHASIAVAAAGGAPAAAAGTMRRLTFGGSTSVVVPAGEQVVSDAVRLTVTHGTDLLVTTYSPTPSGPVTYHPHARQTSYTAEGDRTEDVSGKAYTTKTLYWRYVTAVDVLSNESDGTVVVFGDSLTDGSTSTVDANRRWTDVLAARLRDASGTSGVPRYTVVNQGISGNQVLRHGTGRPAENPSGVSRFARDVLGRTGVEAVVIDLGINDILRSRGRPDADAVLSGLRSMVAQAHARGLRVVGATLMPFRGHRGYREDREAARQAVNAEIRAGRVFDAVVDFDKALRDPYDPRRLKAEYDCGDHLHPSDRGYARMAEVFDLRTLKGAAPAEL